MHVETVILLSRKAPDAEIKVRLDMSELDITSAESKATYKEIQEYVKNKYDLHVTNLYIAQSKHLQKTIQCIPKMQLQYLILEKLFFNKTAFRERIL